MQLPDFCGTNLNFCQNFNRQMPNLVEAKRKTRKNDRSSLLEVRSRRKAAFVLCILFFIASVLYKLLSYDSYLASKVCAYSHHAQIRIDKTANLSASEAKPIRRTPGFRYFDDDLISPQNNIYLERYKLHYCKIDKNMGSTMQAVLCYINDPRRHGRLFFVQPWGAGLDGSSCSLSTSSGDLRKRFLKAAVEWKFFDSQTDIYHFAIIRHPVSRFISAFIDVCVNTHVKRKPHNSTSDENLCFKCGGDLNCFLPLLHDYLHKMTEHMPVERWQRDWHFYPQAWYCDFDQKIDNYHLLRYERSNSFWTEIINVFRRRKVSTELIDSIQEKLRTKKAAHSTFAISNKYEEQLNKNATLLEYIRKIYYLDFLWFDYR